VKDLQPKFDIQKRKPLLAAFYILCSLGILKFLQVVYKEQEGDLPLTYIVFFCITSSIFLLSAIHQLFNNQILTIKDNTILVKNWLVLFHFKSRFKLESIKKINLISVKKGRRGGGAIGFNGSLWLKDYSVGNYKTITLSLKNKQYTCSLVEQITKEQANLICEAIQYGKKQLIK
jgi:hypothetical protein